MLAPHLLGRDPETREQIYDDLKREVRAYDHMGHGPLDIALWDLAGKRFGASVARLLGGFRTRLPTYASTYHGQDEPGGLDTPAAFADYALACKDRASPASRSTAGTTATPGARRATCWVCARVGEEHGADARPRLPAAHLGGRALCGPRLRRGRLFLVRGPLSRLRRLGLGHQRLREKLKTPLLVSEHVRGLEQKAGFVHAGGCDMIHADPEYDMGITGAMKIAHFCEALGLDVQFHACGPAHRAVIAAIRNTHFYELALIGPGMPNAVPPVYACGYWDQPEDVGADGCVPVPDGPGLGVAYDWDLIEQNRTAHHVFE